MPKQGINEWWAIKAPDGGLNPWFIAPKRSQVINLIGKMVSISWKQLKQEGFKLVKVRITEIQEWGE